MLSVVSQDFYLVKLFISVPYGGKGFLCSHSPHSALCKFMQCFERVIMELNDSSLWNVENRSLATVLINGKLEHNKQVEFLLSLHYTVAFKYVHTKKLLFWTTKIYWCTYICAVYFSVQFNVFPCLWPINDVTWILAEVSEMAMYSDKIQLRSCNSTEE